MLRAGACRFVDELFATMKHVFFALGIFAFVNVGCATRTVVRQTQPGEWVRVHETDNNADGWVTHDEWLANGGMQGKLRPRDPGRLPPPRPDERLANLMVQIADLGAEEPLTPVEFKSPAGARFARVEF
jgi:hypothetical protein